MKSPIMHVRMLEVDSLKNDDSSYNIEKDINVCINPKP